MKSQMEPQDTGKFRKNKKDQFYTDVNVAKSCIKNIIDLLPFTKDYLWIEPSAGNGAFLHNIPESFEKIGLDIEPHAADIIEQDYLTWKPPDKKIVVFGNPPFGRQSSLAKAFISKSCEFSEVIAFILPLSFTKQSMFKSFHLNFHRIFSINLEKNSFVINDKKYTVPCVFEIWQKMDTKRKVDKKIDPIGFNYVKSIEDYDIAFRRVGGNAGKSYKNDGSKYSVQSHYFIKFEGVDIDIMIKKINEHIFPTNTTGPRSLSKPETNIVLNEIIKAFS